MHIPAWYSWIASAYQSQKKLILSTVRGRLTILRPVLSVSAQGLQRCILPLLWKWKNDIGTPCKLMTITFFKEWQSILLSSSVCLITSTNQNWKRCNSRGDNWFFRWREKLTDHSFALRAKHSKTNYPSLSHEEVSDGTSASGCLYKVWVRASKNGFGVFIRPLLHSQRAAVRDWYARSIQL